MTFDPRQSLMSLKGRDYLPVAARLQWLNADAPRYAIRTEFLRLEETYAIAQATVTLLDDAGSPLRSACGTKREDKQHFADFLEKAETGAVGRALGMLGYGTQFAPEFDETDAKPGRDAPGGPEPRVVDSPVPRPADDMPSLDGLRGSLTTGSKLGAPTNRNKPQNRPEPEPATPSAGTAALDETPETEPGDEYDHAAVADEDLFSDAKVKRLMAIGGKLFGLKGDPLEARLLEAATKILAKAVHDLHALHWRDGNDVMRALEEQAVKRGVWEPTKA